MSFKNMNPQERMKAFGMLGVIAVLLVFVVHTMLGAIAPKGPQTAPEPVAQQGAAPTLPAPQTAAEPTPGAPATPAEAFPVQKAAAAAAAQRQADLGSGRVNDPFVPMFGRGAAERPHPPVGPRPGFHQPDAGPAAAADPYRMAEAGPQSLPPLSPSISLGPAAVSGPPAAPAPPDPEIRVIGIVTGSESVATLSVAGRVSIARPGDVVGRTYHVASVDAEGVRLRHGSDSLYVRVGTGINEQKTQQ